MIHLEIGQVLLTTTDEKVTIIEMTDSTISVYYRGSIHTRPKSIVGEKLFLTDEDKEKIEIEKQLELRKEIEYKKWLQDMKKSDGENEHPKQFLEYRNRQARDYNDTEKTCKNCILFRSGDCYGRKAICSRFKPVPEPEVNRDVYWTKKMRDLINWKKE